jgi:phage terminase large subunit-like protein
VPLNEVDQYPRDVLDGKILVNKWIRLACERHFSDLANAKELGFYFDYEEAEFVFDFFGLLNLWEGEWAGEPFILEPWQKFMIGSLFGWKQLKDGFRRFRTVYWEVARKNAKSTTAAGIGIAMLVVDGEPGAQIYSAATKRDQAKIIFDSAKNMVEASPSLRGRVEVLRNNMNVLKTNSRFQPLSADAKKMDGFSTSCALVDELHAHPNRRMYDVIETSTGARRQPMMVNVTTAGYDRFSICYEMHGYAKQILEGVIQDESFLALIYALDEKDDKNKTPADDWRDETKWIKANPNLGVSCKLDDLRRKCNKAEQLPSAQNAFRNLHCNEWTEQSERWLDIAVWDENGEEFDPDVLLGRECYAGLDLAKTTDLTALALLFPPEEYETSWKVLIKYWIPNDNIRARVEKDKVPYDVWRDQKLIQTTEGNVTDYKFIFSDTMEWCEKYNVKELAFDRMFANEITQKLQEEGVEVVPFGQGFLSMAAPCEELERMLLGKLLNHNNHPVLRWNASNVAIKKDPAGNKKPDKEKSTEKIDGIVALLMAIGRAIVRDEDDSTVYAGRGITTI